jgi:AcrR family transcriptional regulator
LTDFQGIAMFRSKSGSDDPDARGVPDGSARERILTAAEELFADDGFEATPTSRIAERAGVPKGLVHYYFRRKPDLLVALIERLPDEPVHVDRVVVPGDVAASLRKLVAEFDAGLGASPSLSHLLWREADTHHAVRDALQARYQRIVRQIRAVMVAALCPGGTAASADVDSAAELLALAVSYRHSVARHGDTPHIDREVTFVADALTLGAGRPSVVTP